MKGWWASYINVWFWYMYSQKWNYTRPRYFQNRIIMFYNVLSPNIPHSCFCEWFIYSQNRSAEDRSWKYKNRSQLRNWERGHAVSFLGIYVSHFWYSAARYKTVRQIDSYMFFEWFALSPISIFGDYLRCKVKIITQDIVNPRMNNTCVCSESLNVNL